MKAQGLFVFVCFTGILGITYVEAEEEITTPFFRKDQKMPLTHGFKIGLLLLLLFQVGCASSIKAWTDRSVQSNTAGGFYNLELGTSRIGDPGVATALSLKADRRTVIVLTGGEIKRKVVYAGAPKSEGIISHAGQLKDNSPKNVLSESGSERPFSVETVSKMGMFCAEPPPDAAENLRTSLESTLVAALESENLQAQGKVEGSIKDLLETSMTKLAERTPALDLYRTGVYALCQYSVNGHLDEVQLNDIFKELTKETLNTMVEIAKKNAEIAASEAEKAASDAKTMALAANNAVQNVSKAAITASAIAASNAAQSASEAAQSASEATKAASAKVVSESSKTTSGQDAAKAASEVAKAASEAAKAVSEAAKAVRDAGNLTTINNSGH